MNADGVEVLHVADRDGGIVFVPDYLVLDFLIAFDAFLNQNLRNGREGKTVFKKRKQFRLVIGKSAAGAA